MRVVGQVDDELAEQGAEQLGDDVRQRIAPREQAVDGLGDGHGRVDVRAGDATEHKHREHDAEAVAHGDVQPAGVVTLGVLELDVGHGAVAEDHRKQTWRLYTLPHDEMPAGRDVECPAECNAQKATGISRSDLESQWLRMTLRRGRTLVGETDSSSIPRRRNVSVRLRSAPSSPQMPHQMP